MNSSYNFLSPFFFFFQHTNPTFRFGRRVAPYGPGDYFNDVGNLITAMNNDSRIPNKNMLIAPSVATGPWTPEQVWDTGFINAYNDHLYCLAVEQ